MNNRIYDIVIIGGGPAGMSAALWASDLGLRSLLIEENEALGGQLASIHNPIENYIGIPVRNGREMRDAFLRTLESAKFDLSSGVGVMHAELAARHVELRDGTTVEAEAVIIATGVRRRRLGVEGEDQFDGRGMLSSGSKDVESVKGSRVLIVGGGDAAIENALILSPHADSVTVLHRRDEFAARDSFVEQARQLGNVTLMTGRIVEQVFGGDRLEGVSVRDVLNNSTDKIHCDYCLVRIGVQPNSELFSQQLCADAEGYIKVDSYCRTNIENVYAVGDIANPQSLTISTAAGNAATAVSHTSKQKLRK